MTTVFHPDVRLTINCHKPRVLAYRDMTPAARKAIGYYMAVDGEAWKLEHKAPIRSDGDGQELAALNLRYWTRTHGHVKFGLVHLPTSECLRLSWTLNEDIREAHHSFKSYMLNSTEPGAASKSIAGCNDWPYPSREDRWPCILDSGCKNPDGTYYFSSLLQDGHHRFYRYAARKYRTIPLVFYL